MLNRLMAYARGIARRRRIEAEADDEIAFHLEQETEANRRRGLSPADARRLALASLGGVAQARESIRAVRTTTVDDLWRDIRHAVRSLGATPGFTAVALAVLTLSIGASTAIFSLVDGVVLRNLPFREPDRLVAVGTAELHRLARAADGVHRTGGRRLREHQFAAGGWP
jgi:hypothetical protein